MMRTTGTVLLAAVVVLGLCAPGGGAAAAADPGYRVIVHPANPLESVERRFLADLFLRKAVRWPNGDAARPADLAGDPPVRRRFSEDVVGRSVAAVKSYWQQVIFSGRGLPPPELDDEAAVVAYVLRHAGAVGYVSTTADVGSAKVLPVR